MLASFLNTKIKISNILAIGAALAVMIGSVAIAKAVIPDTAGVIHGCYKNNSGTLRVIDAPTQTCAGGETALNWNQTGPQGPAGPSGSGGIKAYGRVTYDIITKSPVLDTARSSGIFSVTPGIDYVEGSGTQNVCIKLDSAISSNFNGALVSSVSSGEFGPYGTRTVADGDLSGSCPSGADIMTNIGGAPSINSFYFTVY